MSFISIESPYSGKTHQEVIRNVCYALLAVKDAAMNHDEASYASHLLHTQLVFNGRPYYVGDWICKFPSALSHFHGLDRKRVLELTNEARKKVDRIVFYTDLGFTPGMEHARQLAEKEGIPTEERKLPPSWLSNLPDPKADRLRWWKRGLGLLTLIGVGLAGYGLYRMV